VRRLVFALLDAAESGGIPRDGLRALAAIDHTKPFAGFRRLEDLEAAMAAACVELSRALMERRGDPASRRAADIRRCVAERYADAELSTESVCAELGMSRSYLCKIMKKAIGKGFVEYLAGYRVERAKELLRSTDKKLSEIAELVGYTDQRYFGAVFKRETGMTTTEFREAP
jgi:YesN/AraC family two-component response regulator